MFHITVNLGRGSDIRDKDIMDFGEVIGDLTFPRQRKQLPQYEDV